MGESRELLLRSGRQQLHVVLVSCPPSGHALPCSQLARKLATRGVAVSVVSSDLHVEELKRGDIHCKHPNIRLVGLQDGTECSSTTFWQMMHHEPEWETRFGEFLQDLLLKMMRRDEDEDEAAWGPPCCVIADMFTLDWCQGIATKLDLECHAFYTSPASALCFHIHLRKLMQQGRVPVTSSNQSEVVTDIPGLPDFRLSNVPQGFTCDGPFREAEFTYHPYRHFFRIATSSVVLVNSFEELEAVALRGLRTQALGSEFVKARSLYAVGLLCCSGAADAQVAGAATGEIGECGEEGEVDVCIKWLNAQASESVLYVAFGSIGRCFSPGELHKLAKGLEASGQPFLWVLRPPGVHSSSSSASSLRAIAGLLPPGFLERVKERALVYTGWAPQRDILSHPSVGGFLTHCGWNSTTESITAGVPLLAWPLGAEQKINARFLVDTAKLAFECHYGDGTLLEAASIAKLVRKLFKEKEGTEMRSRMKEMQALAIRAASDISINGYMEELQRLAAK